jgi:type IV pilus assembly protein PilC
VTDTPNPRPQPPQYHAQPPQAPPAYEGSHFAPGQYQPQAEPTPASRPKVPWHKRQYNFGKPVKADEIMNFSRQAASFLRAGIPILDAIAVIAEDNGNHRFVDILDDMRRSLRSGMGFGGALEQHRDIFPAYYIAMIKSAEMTGRLDDTLDLLASYIERDLDAKNKIKGALTYPAVVAVMALGAVLILATFVMPRFQELFDDVDAELPLSTRTLLGLTDFFQNWWWVILLAVIALLAGAFALIGGRHGKFRRDTLLLKLPGFGPLFHYVLIERFCRVLSAMVQSGVAIPDALAVSSDATNNRVFQHALSGVREEMMRGGGLARPIADTKVFPAAARQMIRVGESTGTLDRQLESAATFYERELTYKLKRFTDLFEPLVIVGVGLMVGFVAIALVQAMYGVFDQVQT